jgi:hypothetical protein
MEMLWSVLRYAVFGMPDQPSHADGSELAGTDLGATLTMSTLLVTFELDEQASQLHDYVGFVTALHGYPQQAQLHDCAWIIRTLEGVQQVARDLGAFMRPEAHLFVVRIGRDAAWTQVCCGSSWLYENLWG